MIDWTLPFEQLPEEVSFGDLPPVAQALVRRNLQLREKLAAVEASLATAQEAIKLLQATKSET